MQRKQHLKWTHAIKFKIKLKCIQVLYSVTNAITITFSLNYAELLKLLLLVRIVVSHKVYNVLLIQTILGQTSLTSKFRTSGRMRVLQRRRFICVPACQETRKQAFQSVETIRVHKFDHLTNLFFSLNSISQVLLKMAKSDNMMMNEK